MNQYPEGRFFLNYRADTESVDSSNGALPDEVPPQLADTPGPFLKSLGLEPPRPPVATVVASPETSTGRRSEKKKKPSSEWRRRAGDESSLSRRTGGGREEGDYGGDVEDWRGVEAEPWRGRGIAGLVSGGLEAEGNSSISCLRPWPPCIPAVSSSSTFTIGLSSRHAGSIPIQPLLSHPDSRVETLTGLQTTTAQRQRNHRFQQDREGTEENNQTRSDWCTKRGQRRKTPPPPSLRSPEREEDPPIPATNLEPPPPLGNPSRETLVVLNKRSQLKKLCDAYKWKQPVYECCKEEGPSHLRMFTFKVVMEIKKEPSEPNTEVECFSAPHSTKKAAAEHAAEGALWYLSKLGYY
ncbi:hypothetical protein ACLB2K_014063 [Fragaria x ananassa]